ncbi:MAG: amino acid racemase [Butyribacter sp.]|nr:amino acid racemase [bacterium]MDY3853667.1 amino acid racemase [Butyribacter sp.]
MKTIGVIGGLGPMATVYYLELITKMTDAASDQEHPRIVLKSTPDTPDRTSYIIGESDENPLPFLIDAGKELLRMGADFITVPCVTAQYFYKELTEALGAPVISLCGNIAEDIYRKGIKKVGILATSGTIKSRVMEKSFQEKGIDCVVPDEQLQQDVMKIIYGQIKKGEPVDLELFLKIGDALSQQGAEKLILGCTELSLIKKLHPLDERFVDVLEVLAQKAVLFSGAPLKKEYLDVI